MPMTTDWQVHRTIVAHADVTGEEPMRANALSAGLRFRPDSIRIELRRVPDRPYTFVVSVGGPVLNRDDTERRTGRRGSRRYDPGEELAAAPAWVADAVHHLRSSMGYPTLLHFDGRTEFDRHRPEAG